MVSFRTGNWWLWNFIKTHHITSHKIIMFKTRSFHGSDQIRRQNAEKFVKTVKPYIKIIRKGSTYNINESGFNLEVHLAKVMCKSLSNVGVKTVEGGATIQPLSFMIYSYIIMLIIPVNRHVLSPLHIRVRSST